MPLRCSLCFVKFETEKDVRIHFTYFHQKSDVSELQNASPVALEEVKGESEDLLAENIQVSSQSPEHRPYPELSQLTIKSSNISVLNPNEIKLPENEDGQLDIKPMTDCDKPTKHEEEEDEEHALMTFEPGLPKEEKDDPPPDHNKNKENIRVCSEIILKPSAGKVKDEISVLNSSESLPVAQVISCQECHLTCASCKDLCTHYSRDHSLPVVVLTRVNELAEAKEGRFSDPGISKQNIGLNFESTPSIVEAEGEIPVLNTFDATPSLQTTTCQECNLTCASFEHLCVHYSTSHKLPVVVLTRLDKHQLGQKYRQILPEKNKSSCLKCAMCQQTFAALDLLWTHKRNGRCTIRESRDTKNNKRKTSTANLTNVNKRGVSQSRSSNSQNDFEHQNLDPPNRLQHKRGARPKEFPTSISQQQHELTTYYKNSRTKCHLCRREFHSREVLREHNLKVHDRMCIKCDLCTKTFTSFSYLKNHQLTIHDGFRHKCDLCPREFGHLHHLKSHKLTTHAGLHYKCDLCPKEYTQLDVLTKHKLATHQGLRHKCDECPKEYVEIAGLKWHKLTAHAGFRYKCDVCQQEFHTASYLRRHKLVRHEGFSYKCALCQRQYKCMSSLTSHSREIHNGLLYKCKLCGQHFRTLLSLKRHEVTAHHDEIGEQPRGNVDNYNQNLFNVVNTTGVKTSARNNTRDECNQWKHIKCHKVSTPAGLRYKCDVCQKEFTGLQNLGHHKLNTHEGFIYKCNLCLKQFKNFWSLEYHSKKTHNGLRYKCKVCEQKFSKLALLERHKFAAHQDDMRKQPQNVVVSNQNLPNIVNTSVVEVENSQVNNRQRRQPGREFIRKSSNVKIRRNNISEEHVQLNSIECQKFTTPAGLRYRCDVCQKEFTSSENLRHHKLKSHESFIYQCNLCLEQFKSFWSLEYHSKKTHDGLRHKCELCEQKFSKLLLLKRHKFEAHRDQIRKQPQSVDKPKQNLLNIVRTSVLDVENSQVNNRQRRPPRREFIQKSSSVEINRNNIPEEYVQWKSIKCQKLTTPAGLRYKCDVCQKEFASLENLGHHKLNTHQGFIYRCNLCLKQFQTFWSLRHHTKTIHNGARHRCELCEQQFSKLSLLKRHKFAAHQEEIRKKSQNVDNHNQNLPVNTVVVKVGNSQDNHHPHRQPEPKSRPTASSVKMSGTNFPARRTELPLFKNRKQQKYVALDSLPYKCDTCTKTFTSLGNVSRHRLLAHAGFRYTCNLCQAQFTSPKNLKEHGLNVHGGKRTKCDLCIQTFSCLSSLKNHKLKEHTGVNSEVDYL